MITLYYALHEHHAELHYFGDSIADIEYAHNLSPDHRSCYGPTKVEHCKSASELAGFVQELCEDMD